MDPKLYKLCQSRRLEIAEQHNMSIDAVNSRVNDLLVSRGALTLWLHAENKKRAVHEIIGEDSVIKAPKRNATDTAGGDVRASEKRFKSDASKKSSPASRFLISDIF